MRACRSACAAAVAICLLLVVLPLVLLWLPLLSFAVAVVRFRRRRRRMMMTRCFHGGDRSPPPESGPDGHRAARLHKYLEDQMELVEEEARDAMAAVLARNPWAA